MPDCVALLADGVRNQRGGRLDRALRLFAEVAESGCADELRAEALCRQASVHRARCDWSLAVDAARRGAALAVQAGHADLHAEALNAEAVIYLTRGEFEEAAPLLERVLALAAGDRVRGIAAQNLGAIAAQRGDHREAERLFLESRARFAAAGYEFGEATALNNAAAAALDRHEPAVALELSGEAISIAARLGDLELRGIAEINHAEALAGLGRRDEAEERASVALGHFNAAGNALREVECLRLLGDIRAARGDIGTAERCYRRGLDVARRIEATRAVAEIGRRIEALTSRA